jgi:hypothetical protein
MAGVARHLDSVIYAKEENLSQSTIVHNLMLDQLGNEM